MIEKLETPAAETNSQNAGELEANPINSTIKSRFVCLASDIVRVRSIPVALGLLTAMSIGANSYSQLKSTEDALQIHRDSAELFDYSHQDAEASKMWHRAITDSMKLNYREKLTGDMYVRAAKSERHAAVAVSYGQTMWKIPPGAEAKSKTEEQFYKSQQEADLKSALKIYSRIPDTRAEQLVVLNDLHIILGQKVAQANCYLSDGSAYAGENKDPQERQPDRDLQEGLAKLESGKEDLGLACFQRYLSRTHDSIKLANPVIKQIQATSKHDYRRVQLLIPLIHEVIYYCQNIQDLRWEFEWLNFLLASLMDPDDYHDRLNLADSTNTVHGAIIEYSRCLGLKEDKVVSAKLLGKLQEARNTDLSPQQQSDITNYIDCLTRLQKLRIDAFGANDHGTQDTTKELGIASGLSGDFENAEHFLSSLTTGAAIEGPSDARLSLADLYTNEGKFNLALSLYDQVFQELKKEQHASVRFLRWRIARANLLAGRMKPAIQAINDANNESTPDLFGSSRSNVDPSLLME
ncbi:MAG: hypothetical protein EKK48_21630 [Candidatus Melainabacteria bacterium]|nr:MAG: hypothetical protein EKK48_21630 [Candidatus Melainabacteria bacterium]